MEGDEQRPSVTDFALRTTEAMLASQEASLESVRRQVAMILSVGALQAALLGTMTGEKVSVGERVAAAMLFAGLAGLVWRAIETWRPREGFHWHVSRQDVQTMLAEIEAGVLLDDFLVAAAGNMEQWHGQNDEGHLRGLDLLFGGRTRPL